MLVRQAHKPLKSLRNQLSDCLLIMSASFLRSSIYLNKFLLCTRLLLKVI